MKDIVIVAPHPDDELIGCFEILNQSRSSIIIYPSNTSSNRKRETENLVRCFQIKTLLFENKIPDSLLGKNLTFYFPDPIHEYQPDHREFGAIGESLARHDGENVIFYSVNMMAPYIHKVKFPTVKEDYLNKIYPSQKDLWKYEKKYVLYEGYCKWIF